MSLRLIILWLLLLGSPGCTHSGKISGIDCSEKQQRSWRYPVDWLHNSLSIEQAQAVIEADLGATISEMQKDEVLRAHVEDWQTIYKEAEIKAKLWLMNAPPEALGPRGIVLIRECEMVATLITLES